MSDPFPSLSEGQKSCLRLVARGMSSKEIAIETGLAPQTVDTYLKQAIARLGASNRRDAARAFVEWEASRKSGSPSPALAEEPRTALSSPATGKSVGRRWLRLPPVGGSLNDLAWEQKTIQALYVAVIGAVTVLALALLIAGMYRILR
ncbi:MAG: helix-turn-helix transcriptional regulator [Sphingomonas sp.]